MYSIKLVLLKETSNYDKLTNCRTGYKTLVTKVRLLLFIKWKKGIMTIFL